MRDTLQAIIGSGRPWAVSRAEMALAINDQYQGGGLDAGEYTELMEDLVRSDRLNKEADDVELKAMLVSAVVLLSKAV